MNTVLSRLKEISSAVMYAAEATDLETVLQRIAEVSRELAGTKYAALGVPDGNGGLRYFKHVGMKDSQVAHMDHLPLGKGLIGALMHADEPIRLNNMRTDPRSEGFPAAHPQMHSFLGVPIKINKQLYGMLYLSDRQDGSPFDDQDEWLIETLAGYAALAIVGAELRQQQARLRLLEERERIGMELHDGIIQSLYGIGMQVDILRQDSRDMTVDGEDFSPIIDSLNHVIEDIRSFITELRSRGDKQLTIRDSLRQLVHRLHMPADIAVEISAPDVKPVFTPAIFESLLLIANEALSNAIRHGKARRISIIAEQTHTLLRVIVNDNGTGFDIEAVQNGSQGLGLRNMQQRARLYGGCVYIESAPGTGTEVTIEIPLKAY